MGLLMVQYKYSWLNALMSNTTVFIVVGYCRVFEERPKLDACIQSVSAGVETSELAIWRIRVLPEPPEWIAESQTRRGEVSCIALIFSAFASGLSPPPC